MRRLLPLTLLAAGLLSACADDKGAPLEPALTDGKADIDDRVDRRGALPLGGEVTGSFFEDLQFDAYTLDVRAGAEVDLEVTQRGSSRSTDTTLLVYGPRNAAGGFGSAALAVDDDSGWGRLSRLRGLALGDGGQYLVVVGTHDARGRGNYRVTAACASGDCAPLTAAGACPTVIADDIRACIDDVLADPESGYPTRFDAVAPCADAEPVADAYDALCAQASAPTFCAEPYEVFAQTVLPVCIRELENEALLASCAFGTNYRDLFERNGLYVTQRRTLTSAAGLDALTRAQLVLALQASSATDVTTAEEALAAADQGEVNRLEVWEATSRRAFTVYEYGAGDNSYGRYFAQGTTDIAANNRDGDLSDCVAMQGLELRDCRADDDCGMAAGERCLGIAEPFGRGVCVNQAADTHPGEGQECTAAASCPVASGLACAGLSRGDAGLCLPAWMRRNVAVTADASIPAGAAGVRSQAYLYGLTTVDMDVWLDVSIDHAQPAQLKILLANPGGTEVVVYDGNATSELNYVTVPVRGFSGDESVNGVWTLRVIDQVAGTTGRLDGWRLTVGSRWD